MMNFSKSELYEARSSANLRNTVSAIDMVDCALYNLGLGLSKTIVDGMCKMLIFHGDAIEISKGTGFLIFSKMKKKKTLSPENVKKKSEKSFKPIPV